MAIETSTKNYKCSGECFKCEDYKTVCEDDKEREKRQKSLNKFNRKVKKKAKQIMNLIWQLRDFGFKSPHANSFMAQADIKHVDMEWDNCKCVFGLGARRMREMRVGAPLTFSNEDTTK